MNHVFHTHRAIVMLVEEMLSGEECRQVQGKLEEVTGMRWPIVCGTRYTKPEELHLNLAKRLTDLDEEEE